MKLKAIRSALLLAAFIGFPASVEAVTQNLNGFATNTAINSLSFGAVTATVTTISNRSGGTDQAVTFNSDAPTGNDNDLGPFTPGLGQVLIISGPENGQLGLPDDDRLGGTITFDFDRAVNFLSFDFIDMEAPNNELLISASNGFTLVDGGGLSIGDSLFSTFIAAGQLNGITSITFELEGSGAIDNFSIEVVPAPLPVVLLGSVVLAAFAVRRRRRA